MFGYHFRRNFDVEGVPKVVDHPLGLDVELDEESMFAPGDHRSLQQRSIAVTAAEEQSPEFVADRHLKKPRLGGRGVRSAGADLAISPGRDRWRAARTRCMFCEGPGQVTSRPQLTMSPSRRR
jgi:hypothetical protein